MELHQSRRAPIIAFSWEQLLQKHMGAWIISWPVIVLIGRRNVFLYCMLACLFIASFFQSVLTCAMYFPYAATCAVFGAFDGAFFLTLIPSEYRRTAMTRALNLSRSPTPRTFVQNLVLPGSCSVLQLKHLLASERADVHSEIFGSLDFSDFAWHD